MRAWLAENLQKQWYCLGPWHVLLIPLSWLFWLLSGLRRLGYQIGILKSSKLPVPVIVVGNISVGGTGKTPLVIWLAEKLKLAGYSPAIISRGYGGARNGESLVDALSNPVLVGDEPVLLAKRSQCPVCVGQNRVAAAQELLKIHPECNVIISDDGLQHYRLQRDIEIAVIDGERGFGNGWLLPAGPLRERASRLALVDAVVINGGSPDNANFSMSLEAAEFRNLIDQNRIASAKDFFGRRIHAVAGIGNPKRFFQQLSKMSLQFERHAFPDHYAFQASDLQIPHADVILMTEKDAVKCTPFAGPNCWYLPVNAVMDEALATYILKKLSN